MDAAELARLCENLALSDEDGPVGIIDEVVHDRGKQKVTFCLLSKLIMNREVNRNAFRNTITKIWHTQQEVEIEIVGTNMFVFSF